MSTITASHTVRFSNLVAAEGRKLLASRSSRIIGIIGLVAMLTTACLVIGYFTDAIKVASGSELVRFASIPLPLWTMLLVVLLVTSEWGHRTGLTTFTIEPRRGRVTAAKGVVMVAAILAAWLLAQVSWVIINAVGASVHGVSASWTFEWKSWFVTFGGFALQVITTFALALAFRNVALTLCFYLGVPILLETIRVFSESVSTFVSWVSPPLAGFTALTGSDPATGGVPVETSTGTLWGQFLVSLTLWIIVPTVVGWLTLRKADIS